MTEKLDDEQETLDCRKKKLNKQQKNELHDSQESIVVINPQVDQ